MQTKQTATLETNVVVPPLGKTDDPTTSYGKVISLGETMKKMKKGQSFRVDQKHWRRRVTAMSSHMGIKVSTRALKDGKLLVTRLE